MKIIKKADADFPAVHLDYGENFCDYDCHRCSEICPSGAIRRISLEEKQRTQLGIALVDDKVCIRCGLCAMKCPRQIIERDDEGRPCISSDKCIGCGVCQSTCPVDAIRIEAAERQKVLE